MPTPSGAQTEFVDHQAYTYFGPEPRPVNGWLDSHARDLRGRDFTEHLLRDNFNMTIRRENSRLLIDA